ncbi:MAG: sialidase family protein [Candidatus Brocadiia bacterium]
MTNQTATFSPSSDNAKTLAQDYSVVYQNIDGAARGLDGPGIARLPGGLLVVALPVKQKPNWVCQILSSRDNGKSWEALSTLPYYSATPWVHEGKLYLFANTECATMRNGDMHLLCSVDGGKSWSAPVTIAEGHLWNVQSGMVKKDNKLYWAVDDLEPGKSLRGPRVVCGDLSRDPMQAAAWRLSNVVPFPGLPDSLMNPAISGSYPSARMLEPNVIEVNGRIRLLTCVKPPMQATTNLAAVFDLEDDGQRLNLDFTQYHPMPGGQVKFCIVKDETTGLFWMTGNLAVDGQDIFAFTDPAEHRGDGPYNGAIGGNDRRFLILFYGLDGLNWFQAGCIARAPRLAQSFMYPAHIIDGDDLLVVARSSIGGDNRHDADTCTFHRVQKFRELAMNLMQED